MCGVDLIYIEGYGWANSSSCLFFFSLTVCLLFYLLLVCVLMKQVLVCVLFEKFKLCAGSNLFAL